MISMLHPVFPGDWYMLRMGVSTIRRMFYCSLPLPNDMSVYTYILDRSDVTVVIILSFFYVSENIYIEMKLYGSIKAAVWPPFLLSCLC